MPSGARTVLLPEPVENEWKKFAGYSDAGVCDDQLDGLAAVLIGHRHLAAGRRELYGVCHQVPDHLLQPVWVARDRDRFRLVFYLQRKAFRFSRGANSVHRGFQNGDGIRRTQLKRQFARDQPRSVKQVFDQLGLRQRVPAYRFEGGPHLFVPRIVQEDHLRPTEDGVQRRSQFVRHRREKIVLETVGPLCFLAERLLSVKQSLPFVLEPLSLYELRDLAPDRLEHARQLGAGHYRVPGIKFNYPEKVISDLYREPNC